jgi:hypothetical protein
MFKPRRGRQAVFKEVDNDAISGTTEKTAPDNGEYYLLGCDTVKLIEIFNFWAKEYVPQASNTQKTISSVPSLYELQISKFFLIIYSKIFYNMSTSISDH